MLTASACYSAVLLSLLVHQEEGGEPHREGVLGAGQGRQPRVPLHRLETLAGERRESEEESFTEERLYGESYVYCLHEEELLLLLCMYCMSLAGE